MKSIFSIIVTIFLGSLLVGCAESTMNSRLDNTPTQTTPVHHHVNPNASAPHQFHQQESPATQAGKMMAPLTQ